MFCRQRIWKQRLARSVPSRYCLCYCLGMYKQLSSGPEWRFTPDRGNEERGTAVGGSLGPWGSQAFLEGRRWGSLLTASRRGGPRA